MNFPHVVEKAWGYETWVANNQQQGYCGKRMSMKNGWRSSLHRHPIKDETFYIFDGRFLLETAKDERALDREEHILVPGDCIHVPTLMWHRISAIGNGRFSELFEVSTFHSDDDVERLELSGLIP